MTSKKTVDPEMAMNEVEKWLDFKRCSAKKREDSKDAIQTLADGISDGLLILNEDFSLTQTLLFSVGEIKMLKYRARLKMSDIEQWTANIKAGNTHALIRGYVCALTECISSVIKELDTEDNRIAQSVATFFL
jgi:hypothetical protein